MHARLAVLRQADYWRLTDDGCRFARPILRGSCGAALGGRRTGVRLAAACVIGCRSVPDTPCRLVRGACCTTVDEMRCLRRAAGAFGAAPAPRGRACRSARRANPARHPVAGAHSTACAATADPGSDRNGFCRVNGPPHDRRRGGPAPRRRTARIASRIAPGPAARIRARSRPGIRAWLHGPWSMRQGRARRAARGPTTAFPDGTRTARNRQACLLRSSA